MSIKNEFDSEVNHDTDINREWANAYYQGLDDGMGESEAYNYADDALSKYLIQEGLTR